MPSSKKSRTHSKIAQSTLNAYRILAVSVVVAIVGSVLTWATFAAPSSCITKAPGVNIDNSYSWGQWGTYATAGQSVPFMFNVINYDQNCKGSSTIALNVNVPAGFTVSLDKSSVSLKSYPGSPSTGYIRGVITSPAGIVDGDYPVVATVTRGAEATQKTSYYKVYSSDTEAPTFTLPSVSDGAVITGRTFNIGSIVQDNRRVKTVEILIDGKSVSLTDCSDQVAYSCGPVYTWDLRTVSGAHVVEIKGTDFFGNTGLHKATVSVQK